MSASLEWSAGTIRYGAAHGALGTAYQGVASMLRVDDTAGKEFLRIIKPFFNPIKSDAGHGDKRGQTSARTTARQSRCA